jgi:hypothetical protein
VATAAQALWDSIRPGYNTSINPATWLLEQTDGHTFIPIEGGALTGAGQDTGVVSLAAVHIFTFKDSDNHKYKFYYTESDYNPYYHGDITNTAFPAIHNTAVNFVTPGSGSNPNDWATSRGGFQIKRLTFVTGDLNKRIKRARHAE